MAFVSGKAYKTISRKDAKYRKGRKEESLCFLGVLGGTLRLCETMCFS
jgi:hypothetical protein